MSAFDIINAGFARHVLGNATTGDPVRDCAHALTMNHTLKKGSKSRLTGWAIFRASGAVVQADLAATEFVTGDKRTRYEAFAEELGNLQEPAVLLQFTKATVNLGNVFSTIDPRISKICSPGMPPEVFNFLAMSRDRGVAERNILERHVKLEKLNNVA